MAAQFEIESIVMDHKIKQRRLVFQATVVGHATPASKLQSTELSSAAILITEGLTADAEAIESGVTSGLTLSDVGGDYAILFDASKLQGEMEKIYESAADAIVPSASITAGGNMLLEVNSALDFTSGTDIILVKLEYKIR